jgi:hypothetical protein
LKLGIAKVADGIGEVLRRKKAEVRGVRREGVCGSAGSEGQGEEVIERRGRG